MTEYNSKDLSSTLAYIKKHFGLSVFTKQGRVPALMSDLAPSLKNERIMLERLSRLGILEEFSTNINEPVHSQKRIVTKAMTQLTQSEFIRPAIALTYINILIKLFDWKVDVENPQRTIDEKMKFDSQRYLSESQNRDFVSWEKALDVENYSEARLFLNKAYDQGNILAGVILGTIYYSGNGCDKDYDKAVRLFVDGMQRGCPLGAEWLAYAYKYGRGVPKDEDKAKEIFMACEDALEAMCASGSVDAQYAYGFDLLYGNFRSADEKKALYWLQKAMDAGHISAGVQIAKIYLNGWGVEKDAEKALKILSKYSNSVNKNANFELGKLYYHGTSIKRDYKKALKYFLVAADRGHVSSQDYVGDIYYFGNDVSIDYSEARKWYELAEKQGNIHASLQLGFIFFYGEGVDKDIKKAFRYFKQAADRGNARSQYMLHYFYFFEKDYKNYELGKQYLEKSAEQGDVLAQILLAKCYIGSFGFDEEDEKFVYWISKAADQGNPEAQRALGEAYLKLDNEAALPKSYPDAIKWLEQAAAQNDLRALINLAEVYFDDEGIERDLVKTDHYLQRAEALFKEREAKDYNDASEHDLIADLYYRKAEDRTTRQKAFNHYCKALSFGNESSLYDVGWMYFINGYDSASLKLSSNELLLLMQNRAKSASSSNLSYLLGKIFYKGYRIKENKAEAEKWYLVSKEKGSLSACCGLAFYYINDKREREKGFKLLEETYQKGSVEAARLLGLCYKNGIGVKKSRSKAKALLKEAASKGDEDAVDELKKFRF